MEVRLSKESEEAADRRAGLADQSQALIERIREYEESLPSDEVVVMTFGNVVAGVFIEGITYASPYLLVFDGFLSGTPVRLLQRNRTENDPVAAIGVERSCPPAWDIEVSGPSTKRAAS